MEKDGCGAGTVPRTVLIRRKETKAKKVHKPSDPDQTNLTADWPVVESICVDAKILDIEHMTKQFESGTQIFGECAESFLQMSGLSTYLLRSEKH